MNGKRKLKIKAALLLEYFLLKKHRRFGDLYLNIRIIQYLLLVLDGLTNSKRSGV